MLCGNVCCVWGMVVEVGGGCACSHVYGSLEYLGDRAPDLLSKGCGFDPQQEEQEDILLQSQLLVLTSTKDPVL